MLRVFTNPSAIPDGLRPCQMLSPFVGGAVSHSGYRRLAETAREWLRLVPAAEAEIALLPFDGGVLVERRPESPSALALARDFCSRAAAAGLRTLVLVNSDSSRPVEIDRVIVLRTSLDRRTRRPGEFALPAWHEDLVGDHLGGALPIRQKGPRPVVSFCGLAASGAPTVRRRVKEAAIAALGAVGVHVGPNDGVHLRRRAMSALEACAGVDTSFVVRQACFHGVQSPELARTQRREYIDNILGSDYVLCARGYGNFSFRFFETMSLGRIPLLIDTSCVLPLDFAHDYRRYCVVVPEAEVESCGDRAAEHFAALSVAGHAALQASVREFWSAHLSPENFFRNVAVHWRGA